MAEAGEVAGCGEEGAEGSPARQDARRLTYITTLWLPDYKCSLEY